MNNAEGEHRAEIRQALRRYLSRHPRAFDTTVGIRAWWLPEEGIVADWNLLEEVLEALAAQGVIRQVRLADGSMLYGGHFLERN